MPSFLKRIVTVSVGDYTFTMPRWRAILVRVYGWAWGLPATLVKFQLGGKVVVAPPAIQPSASLGDSVLTRRLAREHARGLLASHKRSSDSPTNAASAAHDRGE